MKKFLLTLFLTFPLFAEEAHPIDIQMEKAIEQNSSTAGMMAAYHDATERWDKELNKQYKKLLNGLDAEGQKALKESQRAWIVYRDKEIENIGGFYAKVPGTMFRVISNAAVMKLTKNRALSLSYLADNVELREK